MSYAEVAVPVPLYPYKRFFDYKIPQEFLENTQVGSLVKIPFGRRQSWGIVWKIKESSTEPKIKDIAGLLFPFPVFDEKQKEFVEYLSERYFYPIGEVCEALVPAPLRKCSPKLLEKYLKKEVLGLPSIPSPRDLNEEQKKVLEEIRSTGSPVHLLWGVTGSGKTEIFLRLIREQIEKKKTSIILVPEIALTPQLFSRFEESFPGQVAVFHSAQTEKEQREAWLDICFDRKKIALGARSALFAPVKNLGLVIIDEEHESSYKQDDRLRYHARTAAEKLCQLRGAFLLLASATPSAESYYRAKTKKISLSTLSKRAVAFAKSPDLKIIDLKKNLTQKVRGSREARLEFPDLAPKEEDVFSAPESVFLSQELKDEIQKTLDLGEQGILFLNRRGLGRARVCRSCGFQPECPLCAVSLVPHRNKMLCHYCAYEKPVEDICEKCGGDMKELGFGTEALEKELQFNFPKMKILRLDRDAVQDRTKLLETLDTFANKEADFLIGTQMVAKGHDFPNVTLVGIVQADIGLSLPDFRNEERFFQLLIQVSGRAGRAQKAGRVLLQSFRPEEPIYHKLLLGEDLKNYESFMDSLLQTRELLFYPPYSQLCLLQFQGFEEGAVHKAAIQVSEALLKIKEEGFKVLGPSPSPIFKIRNRFRYQILVKSKSQDLLLKALSWVHTVWEKEKLSKLYSDTRMIIDPEPS
jgi:primosomal protein N' (replication factor Y)